MYAMSENKIENTTGYKIHRKCIGSKEELYNLGPLITFLELIPVTPY